MLAIWCLYHLISFVDCVFYSSFSPVFLHFQLNGVFALSKDKTMFCSMPSAYSKGNITFIFLNKEIKQYGWYCSYNIPVGFILKPVCSYSSHSSYLFPFATLLFLSLMSKPLSLLQAFVISFTSDFIPRMVYQYMYSPDGSMHGFVNHTLSYFNVSHFQDGKEPMDPSHFGYPVVICR